jgi:hypothetical protein
MLIVVCLKPGGNYKGQLSHQGTLQFATHNTYTFLTIQYVSIISLNYINRLVFKCEKCCVLCEVRTQSFRLIETCVSYVQMDTRHV